MPRQGRRPRPEVTQPSPPSLLWTARSDGVAIDCLARLFTSGIYVEVRVDGVPMLGRTFTTSDEAIAFSEQQHCLWAGRRNRGPAPRYVVPES
jgi:hypothetical protein